MSHWRFYLSISSLSKLWWPVSFCILESFMLRRTLFTLVMWIIDLNVRNVWVLNTECPYLFPQKGKVPWSLLFVKWIIKYFMYTRIVKSHEILTLHKNEVFQFCVVFRPRERYVFRKKIGYFTRWNLNRDVTYLFGHLD